MKSKVSTYLFMVLVVIWGFGLASIISATTNQSSIDYEKAVGLDRVSSYLLISKLKTDAKVNTATEALACISNQFILSEIWLNKVTPSSFEEYPAVKYRGYQEFLRT